MLVGRLREAVALAVSQAVAGAVRDALRAVLADEMGSPETVEHLPGSHGPAPPLCMGSVQDPWTDDPEIWLASAENPEELQTDEPPPKPCPGGGGLCALAVGLRAAAWWLQWGERYRMPAAVALGFGVAVAGYVSGVALVAGLGLGLSALTWWPRTEAAQSGAAMRAGLDQVGKR
jgi:hypothetical protein